MVKKNAITIFQRYFENHTILANDISSNDILRPVPNTSWHIMPTICCTKLIPPEDISLSTQKQVPEQNAPHKINTTTFESKTITTLQLIRAQHQFQLISTFHQTWTRALKRSKPEHTEECRKLQHLRNRLSVCHEAVFMFMNFSGS